MFFEAFTNTGLAMVEIILLAGTGFLLVKKKMLDEAGLNTLSSLVINITLPALIFQQLCRKFSYNLYPNWWIFPLISIFITLTGLVVGGVFFRFIQGNEHKNQFLGLVTFQNSGYLPIALVASLLPKGKADIVLVYLFLFLLGFNLVMWSFGVYMLTFHRKKKFEWKSLFSPPVIATLLSLFIVFIGLNKMIPEVIFKPLKMLGECTVPLAMLIVGGSLAQIKLKHINKKAVSLLVLAKMIVMPALGLLFIHMFKPSELSGWLVVLQLAVPSATSLTVILRHYKKEDLLVSQGIIFTYIVSIVTIPVFLSLYRMFLVQ